MALSVHVDLECPLVGKSGRATRRSIARLAANEDVRDLPKRVIADESLPFA
jgi:hypothetical protein